MRTLYKYYVRTVGDFGGCGIDAFEKGFNNYDEAMDFYKSEVEKCSFWKYNPPKVEFIDGVTKAETKLADLKMKVAELETALKNLKENQGKGVDKPLLIRYNKSVKRKR